MNILFEKFKEVLFAVLPITVLVLILNFTFTPLGAPLIIRFLIGSVTIVLGLSLFLLGVDIGVTPIGNHMGPSLTKSNKIWIVGIGGLLLGFFISVAEPDLHILAEQVSSVTSGAISKFGIVGIVSVGIAVMLVVGLVRIVYNIPLFKVLTAVYGLILLMSMFTTRDFLAIAFDASGATTGSMSVPFILALAIGVSAMKKDSKASEKDSFGLVAVASTGAIFSVMIMGLFSKTGEITGALEHGASDSASIWAPFIRQLPDISYEVFLALLPLLIIFLIFNAVSFKLSKKVFNRILKGLLYTSVGLILFLVGVYSSYMDAGNAIGYKIASMENKVYVVIVALVIGLVSILAEPAVYVLTHQIENVTAGYVKRSTVLVALSIGVGVAVMLSVVRILIPQVQLWHFLLPGYLISIALMYIVPKLFIGMAFDSGGVAAGTMTATIILAFTQGVADAIEGADVLIDGFGVIAMVALTPVITLQILGFIYKLKSDKEGIEADAE